MEMTPWRKVLVEPTRFEWHVTKITKTLRNTFCGMACVMQSWCSLWCTDGPEQCHLSNLIVSASYVPKNPSNTLLCYTKMLHDIVFPKKATSSSLKYPQRSPENLMDGFYNYYLDDCGLVYYEEPDGGWFQFDLGSVFTVSEVALTAEARDPDLYFRDIEVRVGLSPASPPGVFSSFTLLGSFVGPGVVNERVVLRPQRPLMARYISLQRRSGVGSLFQVCHMEIR